MKSILLTGFVWFAFFLTNWAQAITDLVNPMIGTSNYGATHPGALVPRGMVSVVPFNVTGNPVLNKFDKDAGWWSAPYANENRFFTGYSHVNLSGVGCPELGVILLMPTTGDLNCDFKEYGSEMSRQEAQPGYYRTYLKKYLINTEVTATERTGLSRFTFPTGKSNILIDLGNGLTNESGGALRIVSNREVEGYRLTGNFCYSTGTERPVYFVARFSKAAREFGTWKKMPPLGTEATWSDTSGKIKIYPHFKAEMAGDSIGAWFTFETAENEQILVEVGISYVSIANARMNLNHESSHFDFESTRQQAADKWNRILSTIQIKGGSKEEKTIFYTALYHIQFHPNLLNDVNGDHPAMESFEIQKVENGDRYTVFSLWDTYRNVHPFLSLVYPQQQLQAVRSMLQMYEESGWLPKWELNSHETQVMEGDPTIPVIVDTWFRGIRDFDINKAYTAMYKSATTEGDNNKLRPDNDDYWQLGYIPLRAPFDNSVSHALEYYIADRNLAEIAKELGKKEDYKRFLHQSKGYQNYFCPQYRLFRPRLANGEFMREFNPRQGENFEPSPGFHEGNSYQYSFCAQHDIKGMIRLYGGPKSFTRQLQKIFDENLFDMTNEPDLHYPWLFNYVKGEEWRTQRELNRLIKLHFHNTPGGLPGNDDAGTLSAWLIFTMMGIYPVIPGNTQYAISTPAFDEIKIKLDSKFYTGKELTIQKEGEGKYIRSITFNGKRLNSYFIDHRQLTRGGILKIYVQPNPTQP